MKQSIKKIGWIIGILVLLGAGAWAGDGQIDIAEIPYTISSSGSYIVVHDLATTQTNIDGITIDADNVTLDLNGHALIGPGKGAGSTGNGIAVQSPPTKYNIAIRNGTVRDWRLDGVYAYNANNSQFEALRCYNNGSNGIAAGAGSTVSGTNSSYNGFDGIVASSGCTVSNNTCIQNGFDGIDASAACTVSNNTCIKNGDDGIEAGNACMVSNNTCEGNDYNGIDTGSGCTVSGNACSYNTGDGIDTVSGSTVSGNTCQNNTGDGINADQGSTVSGNTCRRNTGGGILTSSGSAVSGNTCIANTGDGIQVVIDCRVVDNTCDLNGYQAGDGAGIHVTSEDNCIEHNLVTDNDRGIDVDLGGNYIASNRASGNTTDYDIVGGNTVGAGDLANVAF